MDDEAGGDAKILAVPIDKLSGLYRTVKSPRDLPEITTQIPHFFAHYKDLEPGKWVKISTWVGAEEAKKEIIVSIDRYGKEMGSRSPDGVPLSRGPIAFPIAARAAPRAMG